MSGTADPTLLGPDDFAEAATALLPRGPAWPRDPDSVMAQFTAALAARIAAAHARAVNLLLRESDPGQTVELLPEWERDWGLPDPCTPLGATLEQRHAALLAKMVAVGGQSRAYFIAVAAALGFTVTITEFRAFRAGKSAAGGPLYQRAWDFAWQVNVAQSVTATYFRAGVSAAGEPLAAWSNAQLECVLRRLAPAETTVIFKYGS